jgi:hypothetical protein
MPLADDQGLCCTKKRDLTPKQVSQLARAVKEEFGDAEEDV